MLVYVKWDLKPDDTRQAFLSRHSLPEDHEVPESLANHHDALLAENKTTEAELLIRNWLSDQYDYTFKRWSQVPEQFFTRVILFLLYMCMNAKRTTIDPRVLHSGKAGKHHTRVRDERTGRRRKPKRQAAKHLQWRD